MRCDSFLFVPHFVELLTLISVTRLLAQIVHSSALLKNYLSPLRAYVDSKRSINLAVCMLFEYSGFCAACVLSNLNVEVSFLEEMEMSA